LTLGWTGLRAGGPPNPPGPPGGGGGGGAPNAPGLGGGGGGGGGAKDATPVPVDAAADLVEAAPAAAAAAATVAPQISAAARQQQQLLLQQPQQQPPEPQLTRDEVGESLYLLIESELLRRGPALASLASKATGMLLDGMDVADLLALVAHIPALSSHVQEALEVLREAGALQLEEAAAMDASAPLPPAPVSPVAAGADAGAVSSNPASPLSAAPVQVPFEELTVHKVQQRTRQVMLGQVTDGYKNYLKVVQASQPVRGDPQTPDPQKPCSKRAFDGICSKWRRELHRFDDWAACELMIAERKAARAARVAAGKKKSSLFGASVAGSGVVGAGGGGGGGGEGKKLRQHHLTPTRKGGRRRAQGDQPSPLDQPVAMRRTVSEMPRRAASAGSTPAQQAGNQHQLKRSVSMTAPVRCLSCWSSPLSSLSLVWL
jgi:hypothetical protein